MKLELLLEELMGQSLGSFHLSTEILGPFINKMRQVDFVNCM